MFSAGLYISLCCDVLCVYIICAMKLSSEPASSNDYDLVAIVTAALLCFTLCGILLGVEALLYACLFTLKQVCALHVCIH